MRILGRRHGDLFRRRQRHVRTIYEAASSLHHPRDRGLDHAVEREKHLKSILNLKNLIIAEPSKSIPLSIITDSRESLSIPFRPIEFIRKYPSIFQEFYPGSLNIQPHIKLTPELISLSSEEDLVYESVSYKEHVALRLLKLLMIGRVRKVPIFVLERLRWELGLMKDYENRLIPEFPDYFRIVNGDLGRGNGKMLDLVCWSDEFAISEMEKKCENNGNFEFSVKYPKELEIDKKYKKWVNEWQKLPYVSPYKDSMHLAAKSDESDKRTVAVLHELLNLFIGKKVERDNLLFLGEWLGLRSRFKLSLLQHPGIFYVSGKIGTHTVILKEAYKRGTLTERHPLMDMRFKYVQLMNVVKEDDKNKNDQKKTAADVKEGEEESLDKGEDMQESDDESDELADDAEESNDRANAVAHENANKRGKFSRNAAKFDQKIRGQDGDERSDKRHPRRVNVRSSDSGIPRKSRLKGLGNDGDVKENSGLSDDNTNHDHRNTIKRGRVTRHADRFEENVHRRRKGGWDREEVGSKRYPRRVNVRNSDSNVSIRSPRKPDVSGNRIRLRTEKN